LFCGVIFFQKVCNFLGPRFNVKARAFRRALDSSRQAVADTLAAASMQAFDRIEA
jgi:hypothetical protein